LIVPTRPVPGTGSAWTGRASARRGGKGPTVPSSTKKPDSVCPIVRQTESSTWRASSAFARRVGWGKTVLAGFVIWTVVNTEGELAFVMMCFLDFYFYIQFLHRKLYAIRPTVA
jgi:hypothetical protein